MTAITKTAPVSVAAPVQTSLSTSVVNDFIYGPRFQKEVEETLAIISDTIEPSANLVKKLEEEELAFLKKLYDTVQRINKGLAWRVERNKRRYFTVITHTRSNGEIVKNASRLVKAVKDLYISKGYNVDVYYRHDEESGGFYCDVAISF